ncbi:MAG: hypothetical protein NTZ24_12535 [Deltaproteobacteria bacterium]|nr:hypothetical protein [Deltaproteobacteria bacterium]
MKLKKYYILLKLFIALALVLLAAGCGGTGGSVGSGNADTGAITAKLNWSGDTSRHILSAPAGVVKVRIIVSGTGMTDIQKDFDAAVGQGTVANIPAGSSRTVTAQGLDASGNVIAKGVISNITIIAGQTTDAGTITIIPVLALADLITNGLDSLGKKDVTGAKAFFKEAVDNYPTVSTNDGDTARFFYAFTRAVGVNLYGTGTTGALGSVGDILDRMGCDSAGRSLTNLAVVCPKTLPSNSPTGSELQSFLYTVIKTELEGALANLNAVSTSFSKSWKEPISGKTYISDFGDVLVLKASIKGALAGILIQYAYNLNANIATEANASHTAQVFLSNNTSFLTRASGYATYLSEAKTYLSQVADDLTAAITKIEPSSRNTAAYLINVNAQAITDAKINLPIWKASLASAQKYDNGKDGISGTADDLIVNLSPFFAGINLRDLMPPITGNNASGYFPDATMGGVIVQGSKMNEDKNGNGIPDILD